MHRLRSPQRPLLGVATISLILGSAVLAAGCGGGGDSGREQAAAPTGFDSAYCVTARKWAAHELNGEGDAQYARGGSAALRKYLNEYVAYLKDSREQAPPAIRDAAAIHERAFRTRVVPVLEKYGFEPKRLEAEASASEKATLEPTPKEAGAQAATHAYDDRVCLYGGSPPAAKVTFKRTAAAKPYCEAVAAQERGLEKVVASRFDPEAFRSYVTSDSFLKALDAQDANAPAEVAADVKADNEWVRERKLKVLEDFEYDLRRLLLEGSADDLAVFTYWHPAIRAQDSRVTAYVGQVCGG